MTGHTGVHQIGEPGTKRGFSLREASYYLGMSETVLRDELRHNRITARRKGTKILFDRYELDRYFENLPEDD